MHRSAAQSAEAAPSDTRWSTELTVCKSPHHQDLAEVRVLLRAGQGWASAEAVPLPVLSSTRSVAGETVTRDDLAELHTFLGRNQQSAIGLAATCPAKPPTQISPPCREAASPPATGRIPAGPEGPQQIGMLCAEQSATRFQISTPPAPLPPRLSSTSMAAAAATAASADQSLPMLAACPAAASPPAARWGLAGSEEYQQTRMRSDIEPPKLFQTSTPPQPPPPRPISTVIPPPPLLCPDATMSAAGSPPVGYPWPQQTMMTSVDQVPTAGSEYWLQQTWMRLGDQIPTTGSNSTGYFGRYDTRLTYKEGNVCIEYTRDGQQALTLTMPADEATRLAAALTGLLQLAGGTVTNHTVPTSWT